ncbi:hypothetical protein [Primorskyibacter sp. S187A]|uniref:hypothetical protein n=1 Tax=Primorskyibacter sp. S187A TaxID=3415130 RepID=UPI003C7973F7
MKTILVHIGMHKTGSSSVQRSLVGYDDGRVRYADLSNENHSVPVNTIFAENRYEKRYFRQRGITRAQVDEMAARFRKRLAKEIKLDRDVLILSGEDISRIPLAGVQDMHDMLAPECDRVLILGYARDPISFASSSFQQLVKFDCKEVMVPQPDYRRRFKKFLDVFGKDNVVIKEFRRDLLYRNSVVRDVMEAAGIGDVDWPETVINESLSDPAMRVLFHFNRNGPLSTGSKRIIEIRKRFVDLVSRKFKGASFRLPDAAFTARTVDVSDVTWLAKATGVDFTQSLPALTETELPDLELEADLERLRDDEVALLTTMMARRKIKHGDAATPTDLLTLLFYDELARAWSPKKRRKSKA